jgi:exopolysaccharide production protein ExoQ
MAQPIFPARNVAAAWQRPVGATSSDRWVEPLAVVVLALTLFYAIFGSLSDDAADVTQTDHVNPWNSRIWLGLLMMAAPVLIRRWRDVLQLAVGNWALLALFGYFALSVGWALDPSASLRRLMFSVVQLVLLTIVLSGIRRAPLVHVVIVAICAASATADLLTWVVAPGFAMTDEGFAGLQSQKNQTGLLMMYGCLAAGPCVFLVRRRLWKIGVAASAVMMAGLLVATRSTTSQSVVICAAFVMPLLLLIAKLPKQVILAIAASVVLVLLVVPLGYLAWCGVTGIDPMLPLRGVTLTSRTDIWSFVVGQIGERPWFGAGYSSFWSIDPAVQPSLKSDQWFGVNVMINEGHNGYLDALATGGVIGLVGALFVLIRSILLAGRAMTGTRSAADAWRDGHLAWPTAVFHLALLLGLILHNFTESNLFSNNGLLALVLLLSILDLEKWRIATRRVASP